MSKHKTNILKLLSDFVDYNYITEWQAGYIVGMINCQENGYTVVDKERIFNQLILFICNKLDRRTNG